MKTWGPLEVCATICLVVMGTLLILGRDSTLTVTFCSISGAIFTKGLGIEIRQRVKEVRGKRDGDGGVELAAKTSKN